MELQVYRSSKAPKVPFALGPKVPLPLAIDAVDCQAPRRVASEAERSDFLAG